MESSQPSSDNEGVRLWVLFSLLYFSATLTSTFTKELWFDELVSLYVDRLSGAGQVWQALAGSVDAMPPLFHAATWISHALIADDATAARLPSAIGYWVACLSAWTFLRRRMETAYAWCGVAPMLLPAPFYFATEGRAYGMMLGFAGLTVLFWQRSTEPRRSWWHLAGVALFLCCTVSSHYYGVFLTIPLATAELYRMRNWSHGGWRRHDWPMLASIGSVLVPLLVYQPLIRAADIYRADTWAAPRLTDTIRVYAELLAGGGPALAASLIAAGFMMWWNPAEAIAEKPEGLRRVDIALAFGFLTIPLAVLGTSFLVTGTFFPRYGINAMFGIMFASAEALRRLCPSRRAVAAGFATVLLGGLGAERAADLVSHWGNLPTAGEMATVERLTVGPVVVEDAFDFLRNYYYAPPELARRLVYLPDAKAGMEWIGVGNPDIGLEKLQPLAKFQLGTKVRYLDEPGMFYMLTDPARAGWLPHEMERRRLRAEVVARLPRHWLMKVSR